MCGWFQLDGANFSAAFGEYAMGDSLIANILCRGQISVVADDVVRTLQQDYGIPSRVALHIPGRDGSAIISIGSVNILVMIEDNPLSLDPQQPDSMTSSGGNASLLEHRTHAMVSLLNVPADQTEKMQAVLSLVQVVSAVALRADGSAILWSESGTLLPIGQFRDLTARWTALTDEVPLLLICRVLAYRDAEDGAGQVRHGVFSVGLKSFIGREVELAPRAVPLEEAMQSFQKMAYLLLRAGSLDKEGDTSEVPTLN